MCPDHSYDRSLGGGSYTYQWIAPPPDDLVWASWGDDQVAYHRPSGRTHFLNAASHFLISEFLREPRDLESVVDAFLTDDGNGDNGDALVREEISRLLDRLEQLGLISPA